MAKLYISIYRPDTGNYYHWALYLNNNGHHSVFEVIGEHPEFKRNFLAVKPEQSHRHKTNILVGTINEPEIPNLVEIMDNANIDNETMEWNCQDYVLEALEELVEACIIDNDDEDYVKGVKKAKKKYFGQI